MKKTLCTVVLLACALYNSAQNIHPVETEIHKNEWFMLDSAFTKSKNYEFYANDSIVLTPNFSRNSNSFHAFLDLYSEFSIENMVNYPPQQGLSGGPNEGDNGYVGALGGTIDVSATGGAFYTIPIEVPVGINGMQPELSLVYNSQGGNGLVGWKWDLAGLSSITRTGRTLYHDGVKDGVTLNDTTDRFLLDGQRLIQVHDYGDSIEYRTEQDGMVRIRAYVNEYTYSIFGQTFTIPYIVKFKVWNPDGTIKEYGFTSDSRINPQTGGFHAMCWLLNKVIDRNGNAIVYNYTELCETGEYYIQSIEYTENERLSIKPEFTIEFDYFTERSDYEFAYVNGNIIQNKRILSSIIVMKNNETELYQYNLNYSATEMHHGYNNISVAIGGIGYYKNKIYHRLISIELEKNGMQINPTRILWEWDEKQTYQQNDINTIHIDTTNLNNFIFVGDFNADGFSDVLTVPYKSDSGYTSPVDMNVLLNTGQGSFQYSSGLSMNVSNENPLSTYLDWIHVVDINDDGYDDLILQFFTPSSVMSKTSLMPYLNQGGESFSPAWAEPIEIFDKLYLVFGDFLGEGKQTALVFRYFGNDNTPVMFPLLYIYCENNTFSYTVLSNLETIIANDIVTGDFDGDGHTEIMLVNTVDTKIYHLRRNNGNLLFELEKQCFEIAYVPELNLFPGDYNGDGKDDLLCYGKANLTDDLGWFFLISSGLDFRVKKTAVFHDYGFSPQEKLYTYSLERVDTYSSFSLFASDFDGDGLCDIALSKNKGDNCSLSVYSKFVQCFINIGSTLEPNYRSGFNPLADAYIYGTVSKSQYMHVGNFFGKDNMSFLGNEVVGTRITPVLCTLYSLNEYNSMTCVIDGMGNQQRLSYSYPAVVDTPQSDLGNDIISANVPIRTVKSVTSFKINDAKLTSTYSFKDAAFHKKGHGYLGFLNQETINKTNTQNISKHAISYEIETMGAYAFSLPSEETSYIYKNNQWLPSVYKTYDFRNVVSTLEQKIVKPAMMGQTSVYYNTDNPSIPNECLKKEIVEYDYSIGTGNTYDNAYNCIETRTGIDQHDVSDYSSCEFKTIESINFYNDNIAPWIINRPHNRTVVQSKIGKPNVNHCWWYEYVSANSYQIRLVYDIPYLNNNQDPLMVETDFDYYDEGNLKTKIVKAPHALQGEQEKTVAYVYGPGEGSSNQHRLVTKETTSCNNLVYQTEYVYDSFDNIDTIIGSNGLITKIESDALGIETKTINADGTQSCSVLRWAEGYTYAPDDALYYKWSRSSGGNKTLTFYHRTGAELRSVTFGLNDEAIIIDKEYDSFGRLSAITNPYMEGEIIRKTYYEYDNLDRLTRTITPDGTTTSIEYLGNQTETTITPFVGEAQQSMVTVNAMGWTVRSDDASENSFVTYDYFADGLLAAATVNNDPNTTISATYDNARNRSTLTDPNYGTLTTVYNAYGELRRRVSPKELEAQKETTYQYDGLGRLVRETNSMENTTTHYIFDEEEGALKGTLKYMHHRTIEGQAIQNLSYEYDELARLVRTTEQRLSGTYVTELEYDEYSHISQTTYPTGVCIKNEYKNGYIRNILDAENHGLWRAKGINAYGQLTDATLGNGVSIHYAYKPEMHYIDSIVTSNNLQNLSYDYDKFGNLASRKDNLRNLEETFHYDKMNRLTDIYLGNTHSQIVYDPLGRMTSKQADGQTVFANASFTGTPGQPGRPHAMKSAETSDGVFPSASQSVNYTSFDKVKAISEDGNGLIINYGFDHQRIRMYEVKSNGITINKDYVGVCEYITEDQAVGGMTQKTLTYLVGPFGVFAVVEKQNNEESIHYILKDHLGSWTTITDSEGNVEQELSFDAWGNLRNPATWTGTVNAKPMFDRGFTGHEHISDFGLINMNGRCYDQLTSSFLSVDAYVEDPANAQAFNRYAYCGHNPLRYTDPTGWYYGSQTNYVNPNINSGHTTYYSDDPNDMLWGRSVHPCANSSSGYINGTPYSNTSYTQGNNGQYGYNYTVDKQGYVKKIGSNKLNYDILYTSDAFAAGDYSNGLCINDTSILPSLNTKDPFYDGNYVIRNNIDEMVNLFLFMANNTEVEWRFDGYRTSNNVNEYIVATSHQAKNVAWSTCLSARFQEKNQIFDIHSHQGISSTKGASGWCGDGYVALDMKVINDKYIRYNNNSPNDHAFPKHYVYHQYSKVLYEYTVYNPSIKRRTIKTYQDFLVELKKIIR